MEKQFFLILVFQKSSIFQPFKKLTQAMVRLKNEFFSHIVTFFLGAIRWLAPELCFDTPERSSFRSDVWAFGCVLIEVITQDVPWVNEFARHRELMKALSDRQNAPYFEEVLRKLKAPDKLRALLCACCTWPKLNRPSFDKIIKDLNSMSDSDLQVGTEGKGPMKLAKHPAYGNRALYSSDEEENYVPNGKPPKKNQDLPSVITDKF